MGSTLHGILNRSRVQGNGDVVIEIILHSPAVSGALDAFLQQCWVVNSRVAQIAFGLFDAVERTSRRVALNFVPRPEQLSAHRSDRILPRRALQRGMRRFEVSLRHGLNLV